LSSIKEKSKLSSHHQYKNFDQVLLEAIDEGLSGLGEAGKASIYIYLERGCNIRKQEIPNKLSDFSNALERILGSAARQLEKLFMKHLGDKLKLTSQGSKYQWPLSEGIVPEITFSEYVRRLRKKFEEANADKGEMGILENEYIELRK
jgi:hypothetical protein